MIILKTIGCARNYGVARRKNLAQLLKIKIFTIL